MSGTNTAADLSNAVVVAGTIFHILDAAFDALDEMDFGPVGARNQRLERIEALLHAARSLAADIGEIDGPSSQRRRN